MDVYSLCQIPATTAELSSRKVHKIIMALNSKDLLAKSAAGILDPPSVAPAFIRHQ